MIVVTDTFYFTQHTDDLKQCEADYLEMKRLSKVGLMPKIGDFCTLNGNPYVSLKTKVDIDVWNYEIGCDKLLKLFNLYKKYGYLADVLNDKALIKTENKKYLVLDMQYLKKTNDERDYKLYLCKIYDFYYKRKHILDIKGLFKKINLLPEEYKSFKREQALKEKENE